jgi:hypothetical protein
VVDSVSYASGAGGLTVEVLALDGYIGSMNYLEWTEHS